jgi:hypothetical protein
VLPGRHIVHYSYCYLYTCSMLINSKVMTYWWPTSRHTSVILHLFSLHLFPQYQVFAAFTQCTCCPTRAGPSTSNAEHLGYLQNVNSLVMCSSNSLVLELCSSGLTWWWFLLYNSQYNICHHHCYLEIYTQDYNSTHAIVSSIAKNNLWPFSIFIS